MNAGWVFLPFFTFFILSVFQALFHYLLSLSHFFFCVCVFVFFSCRKKKRKISGFSGYFVGFGDEIDNSALVVEKALSLFLFFCA